MRQEQTDADFAKQLLDILEQDTQKDIFTIKFLNETEDGALETIVVFKDRSVMMGDVSVVNVGDHVAFRLKGKYI